MATVTMEVTGPLADIQVGDTLWLADDGSDALPTARTVLRVEYEYNEVTNAWQVEGFRVTMSDDDGEHDEDDWDWVHRSDCFRTEKEALEYMQRQLDEDAQDREQGLADLHRLQHQIQRRLMVLAAEDDPFESE